MKDSNIDYEAITLEKERILTQQLKGPNSKPKNDNGGKKAYQSTKSDIKHLRKKNTDITSVSHDEAIQNNPQTDDDFVSKGKALYDSGNKEEAILWYNEAIKFNPKDDAAYFNKGLALYDLGKIKEAILCYDEAINLNLRHDAAYFNKGLALYDLDKKDEAVSCYDQAIKINPKFILAYNSKGRALRNLGKEVEAIFCIDQAINLKHDFDAAYFNKGLAFFRLGKMEDAISCFDKAIEINPDYDLAYLNKGSALDEIGKKHEAIECFDKVIKINPNSDAAYNNKGSALDDLGMKEEAIFCYDQAIKLNPKNALCYCNKGKALNSLGKDEKALECFNEAYELFHIGQDLKLTRENTNFIKQTISEDRIVLLEKLKKLQQVSLETAEASKKLDFNDEKTAKLFEEFEKLKEQKNKVTNHLISGLHKDSNNTMIIRNQILAEQASQIDEIQKQMETLKQEMLEFISQVTQQLDKHEVALTDGGIYAKAKVVQSFKELENKDPELYIYCKTFYWTTLHLFGAYRSLSTGIVQGNLENNDKSDAEQLLSSGAEKMVSYGIEIAKGIPFVGGLIGAIENIVRTISNATNENDFTNKINAVNKVIQNKFGQEDDISVSIGQLALAITKAREQNILYPEEASPSKYEQGMSWLNKQIDKIKGNVLSTVDLNNNNSFGVSLALRDVALFISYLCKNSETVIKRNAPLDSQLSDILKWGGLDQMLKDINNFNQNIEAGRKRLEDILAKQTFSSATEKTKLIDYYNSFVQTFKEIYLTSLIILDKEKLGNIAEDPEDTPNLGVLLTLICFLPVARSSKLPKNFERLDQLIKSKELINCAFRMKWLSTTPEILIQLASECSIEIVTDPKKKTNIIAGKEDSRYLITPFEDEVKDKLPKSTIEKILGLVNSKLSKEVYQTSAAKLGYYDANRLIQMWLTEKFDTPEIIGSVETGEMIKQEFIKEVTQKDKIDEKTDSQTSCLAVSRQVNCNLF